MEREAVRDVMRDKVLVLGWEHVCAFMRRKMRCWKLAGNASERVLYSIAIRVRA